MTDSRAYRNLPYMSGSREIETVSSGEAPAAIGPYSQAVRSGGLIFCSGQIGLDPDTGSLAGGGIEEETNRVLSNLAAVLREGGSDLSRLLKVTIYLTRMEDFVVVNEIYARHLGSARPARATVGVAALPKGARVEIDAIALSGGGT